MSVMAELVGRRTKAGSGRWGASLHFTAKHALRISTGVFFKKMYSVSYTIRNDKYVPMFRIVAPTINRSINVRGQILCDNKRHLLILCNVLLLAVS